MSSPFIGKFFGTESSATAAAVAGGTLAIGHMIGDTESTKTAKDVQAMLNGYKSRMKDIKAKIDSISPGIGIAFETSVIVAENALKSAGRTGYYNEMAPALYLAMSLYAKADPEYIQEKFGRNNISQYHLDLEAIVKMMVDDAGQIGVINQTKAIDGSIEIMSLDDVKMKMESDPSWVNKRLRDMANLGTGTLKLFGFNDEFGSTMSTLGDQFAGQKRDERFGERFDKMEYGQKARTMKDMFFELATKQENTASLQSVIDGGTGAMDFLNSIGKEIPNTSGEKLTPDDVMKLMRYNTIANYSGMSRNSGIVFRDGMWHNTIKGTHLGQAIDKELSADPRMQKLAKAQSVSQAMAEAGITNELTANNTAEKSQAWRASNPQLFADVVKWQEKLTGRKLDAESMAGIIDLTANDDATPLVKSRIRDIASMYLAKSIPDIPEIDGGAVRSIVNAVKSNELPVERVSNLIDMFNDGSEDKRRQAVSLVTDIASSYSRRKTNAVISKYMANPNAETLAEVPEVYRPALTKAAKSVDQHKKLTFGFRPHVNLDGEVVRWTNGVKQLSLSQIRRSENAVKEAIGVIGEISPDLASRLESTMINTYAAGKTPAREITDKKMFTDAHRNAVDEFSSTRNVVSERMRGSSADIRMDTPTYVGKAYVDRIKSLPADQQKSAFERARDLYEMGYITDTEYQPIAQTRDALTNDPQFQARLRAEASLADQRLTQRSASAQASARNALPRGVGPAVSAFASSFKNVFGLAPKKANDVPAEGMPRKLYSDESGF